MSPPYQIYCSRWTAVALTKGTLFTGELEMPYQINYSCKESYEGHYSPRGTIWINVWRGQFWGWQQYSLATQEFAEFYWLSRRVSFNSFTLRQLIYVYMPSTHVCGSCIYAKACERNRKAEHYEKCVWEPSYSITITWESLCRPDSPTLLAAQIYILRSQWHLHTFLMGHRSTTNFWSGIEILISGSVRPTYASLDAANAGNP